MQYQREEWNQEKDWSVEHMSLNWDYEIISEQTVLDLSYRTVKEILRNDIKMIGYQNAFRKAIGNFDIAVKQLSNATTEDVTDRCDNSFRILMSTYTALVDISYKEIVNIDIFVLLDAILLKKWDDADVSKLYINEKKNLMGAIYILEIYNKGCDKEQLEDILSKLRLENKNPDLRFDMYLNHKLSRDSIQHDLKICKFIFNIVNNKSLTQLLVESMDYVIQVYCKENRKDIKKVRKKIYNEASNFASSIRERRDGTTIEQCINNKLSSALCVADNLLFAREEKINNPFKYYEEHGFGWSLGKK